MTNLIIDGKKVKINEDYSLRWVDEDSDIVPVLYYQNNKVTQSWSVDIFHEHVKDRIRSTINSA